MKSLLLILLLLLAMSLPVLAQTPSSSLKFAFAGVAYFQSGTPQIQGFGGIAIPITLDSRILSYTDWDVAATPVTPVAPAKFALPKISYSIREGLAYRLYQISSGVTVYGLGNAGVAFNGANTVGSFGAGGFIDFAFGKGWGGILVLEVNRNANTGTDFVPRFGIRKVL